MGNPCVSHSITEPQIDDNYELLCRLWSPLVRAEEGGGCRPLSPVALKELTSYFRAFLRFFNVIPTSFARHICFNLFITIGNTVPQVTGLDPTTVFTLSPEVVHNKEDDEDVSSDGIMGILCQR